MRLKLIFKDFSQIIKGASHIGLGITCQQTAAVLRKYGIDAEAVPVTKVEDVIRLLESDKSITHMVIGAPWIGVNAMEDIVKAFSKVKFAVVCHSNISFLGTEPEAIKLLRGYKSIQDRYFNFKVAGNSGKFVSAWHKMYDTKIDYLPNLYDMYHSKLTTGFNGDEVKIGVFGSVRPLKNFVSAVAACIEISNRLRKPVKILMSSGRDDNSGNVPNRAINALTENLNNIKLERCIWRDHKQFRKLVGSTDLGMQCSYTESFNMVTADFITEGLPVVVSEAITWAPHSWKANVDSVSNIAAVGIKLLNNRVTEATDGLVKL